MLADKMSALMRDRLLGQSLRQFADLLSSTSPTPGGGSAAAYAGALGAALAAMVGRIALARGDHQPNGLNELVEEAENLRTHFLRLVEDDSAAFDRVAEALKMPKENEDQKTARSDALQAGLLAASRAPLDTAKAGRRLLELCDRLLQHAPPVVVSDAGVGALLAETAIRGAALNVMINLASLKDAGQVKALSEELDQAIEGAEKQRLEVVQRVEARIAR
jgi:glutamate formiminotransferase/formiminotetrahydrofolate cyclodeaminase